LHARGYLEALEQIKKAEEHKSEGGMLHGLQVPDIEHGQVLKKPGTIKPRADSGRLDDLL
jgi:translation elongation factor EF-Tu-like GTPase